MSGFGSETITEWHKHGLPGWVQYKNYNAKYTDQFFGMDSLGSGP